MKIGNILGRRKSIFLAATLTLIGEALCTSSFGLAQFIVGRTIIGLGIGILSATVPVWQAECSSAANRGKHVELDGLFMTCVFSISHRQIVADRITDWDTPLNRGSISAHHRLNQAQTFPPPGECLLASRLHSRLC